MQALPQLMLGLDHCRGEVVDTVPVTFPEEAYQEGPGQSKCKGPVYTGPQTRLFRWHGRIQDLRCAAYIWQ